MADAQPTPGGCIDICQGQEFVSYHYLYGPGCEKGFFDVLPQALIEENRGRRRWRRYQWHWRICENFVASHWVIHTFYQSCSDFHITLPHQCRRDTRRPLRPVLDLAHGGAGFSDLAFAFGFSEHSIEGRHSGCTSCCTYMLNLYGVVTGSGCRTAALIYQAQGYGAKTGGCCYQTSGDI